MSIINSLYITWDPIIGIPIGDFTLRFYSLTYVVSFILGYYLMANFTKKDMTKKQLDSLLNWSILAVVLGARLGHVLFYERENMFSDWQGTFLPFRLTPKFEITGYQGLASHGAGLAMVITLIWFSRKVIKKNPMWLLDRVMIVFALGAGFIRLGNFMNSEIVGKATHSDWGVLFVQQSTGYGPVVPRYPAQLMESIGYFICFFILFWIFKKTPLRHRQGWIFGLTMALLSSVRFFMEFFKEPQGDEFVQFWGLNTGQVLSIPFILAGLYLIFTRKSDLK